MKHTLAYLCSSESWGGLEMNHLRNAVWMKQRGHSVIFICLNKTPLFEQASMAGLKVISIDKYRKYFDYRSAFLLQNILIENNVTHLLIRATRDLSITATVKRLLKDKIHTSYFMEMQLGVKKKGLLHSIRFKGVDLWSCPLDWLKEQVSTMTNFSNKLVVIPSAMDLGAFQQLPTKDSAREELSLPKDKLIFGLIGRFDPQKGQLLLIEAMNKCLNKNFHVVFLGEPTLHEGDDYVRKLKESIDKFELGDRVHLRPYRKDIITFYTAIDWFVMASKAETFGMVTIESLACGTPVLGSNAGGTPEILGDSKGGRLFKTLDSNDLAKQIDSIISDKITIPKQRLKEMVRIYDHFSVCEQVEEQLKIKNGEI